MDSYEAHAGKSLPKVVHGLVLGLVQGLAPGQGYLPRMMTMEER